MRAWLFLLYSLYVLILQRLRALRGTTLESPEAKAISQTRAYSTR